MNITFTTEQIKELESMGKYWDEVRQRQDHTPLIQETAQVFRMLGASKVLACVQNAVAGATNGCACGGG